MKKIFVWVFLVVINLTAVNAANACGNCDDLVKTMEGRMGDKNKLPSVRVRDRVFQCAGVFDYLAGLDEMDKDLLYMKATIYSFEKYSNAMTKQVKPVKFSKLIPLHKLSKLYGVVRQLYKQP